MADSTAPSGRDASSQPRIGIDSMRVAVVYNLPTLDPAHPDYASEAGVFASLDAIAGALAGHGHAVERVGIGRDYTPLVELAARPTRPEVIVNLCESFAGSSAAEAHFAALLELTGISYTGNTPETLALGRDKARTKWQLRGAGAPTAEFLLVRRGEPAPRERLERALSRGPQFVKPASEDASLGISGENVVTQLAPALAKIEELRNRYGDVLVEEYIDGREFNVGVVALPDPQLLPLAEVNFGHDPNCAHRIVTYDAKWTPGSGGWRSTPVNCPAEVVASLAERIRAVALAAFAVTGCRDYARIDLRVRGDEVLVLEVNANPDLDPEAGFARALRVGGIAYEDFAERLVRCAAARGG